MYQLTGSNYYEQVNQATGKLSSKIKELIATHSDDDRVYELSGEFVAWWHSTFTPSKDAVGRSIWTRADELAIDLANNVHKTDKVGKVGKTIGKYVGLAAGATVNATISSSKWLRSNAKPVSNSLWSTTKEAYKQSRGNQTNDRQQSATKQSTDDSPY